MDAAVQERIDGRRQTYGSDPTAASQKLADLQRRIDNYYRAIGEGMDPQVCQQHIAELTAKRDDIEHEASVLRQEDYYVKALEMNLAELRRLTAAFQSGFEDLPFATRRQIILYFVRSIEVLDRDRVRIRFQIPFDNNGIRLLTDEVTGKAGEVGADTDVSGCYPVISPDCAGRPTTGSQ